jgi:hypothetical protein
MKAVIVNAVSLVALSLITENLSAVRAPYQNAFRCENLDTLLFQTRREVNKSKVLALDQGSQGCAEAFSPLWVTVLTQQPIPDCGGFYSLSLAVNKTYFASILYSLTYRRHLISPLRTCSRLSLVSRGLNASISSSFPRRLNRYSDRIKIVPFLL